MKQFTKTTLHKQLALASLLGANAFAFGSSIYISNGDIWYGPIAVTADITYPGFDNATPGMVGIYNPTGPVPAGAGSETYINLGSGSEINSTGSQSAYGIVLRSDGAEFLADELEIKVQGGGNTDDISAGLYLSGAGGSANLGSNSKITVDGRRTMALYVANGSSLIADQLTTTISGGRTAIEVRGAGSSVDLGSNSIINTINTSGTYGNGVELIGTDPLNLVKFKANSLTVNSQNVNTGGIRAYNGEIDLGSNSVVTTTGKSSSAVQLSQSSFSADALTIKTSSLYSNALNASSGSTVTIGENSHITAEQSGGITSQQNSTVNFKGSASNRNTVTAGSSDYANAIEATVSSIINLDNVDVVMTGSDPYSAILSSNNGGVTGTEINASNSTFKANNAGVTGARAQFKGKINFSGETLISMATSEDTAIQASSANSQVNGSGKMTISGSVIADDSAVVDLNMNQGSLLTGKTSTISDTGTVNLALSDSRWEMIKDSTLSKLALNNSTVNFAEDKVGSLLTTKELSGNGTFLMQVDMAGITGDKLKVTETSSGSHHITALNNGSAATTGNELLTIVETADGGAAFDLTSKVEVGGYVYDLRRKSNNTDWELFAVPQANPAAGGDISTAANASANFLNAGYLLNYAETQTLLQRMGELRQAENSQGDVWVRAYTGKLDSFDSGKLSGFDMDYTGVQAGVDKRLDVNSGDLYLGAMVGTSQADPNYVSGDGDLKSYNVGIYGTYVADNDFYVDGVLKYNHMKNKFNHVLDTQKNLINGDAKSDGYGISLEVGKRFYFDQTKSGYYIEPQAQLTYTHQGSASTTASNGLVTDMDAYDSTIGRISALIGYEVKSGANPMNVYVKTGYVTELSGDVNYALNGHKENHDFGGSWWDNGIGVTAQINKKHNLYLEGTYSTGSRFDQMQINAGYRYSF